LDLLIRECFSIDMASSSWAAAEGAHPVVSDEEWIQARLALLEEEKAHSKATAALATKRQALPHRIVKQDYTFTGQGDKIVPLSLMFGASEQLVVYHLMMGGNTGCVFYGRQKCFVFALMLLPLYMMCI
jgi:predicted dithiol-disulfide oxidoreductase (DUF899 family)